jgi:hypothetical protein
MPEAKKDTEKKAHMISHNVRQTYEEQAAR